jgi:predicted PurR-regulated permease PerM
VDSELTHPPSRASIPAAPGGRGLLVTIVIILVVAALHLAGALLIPIVVSVLLSLLLGPQVRWLRLRGVPEWVGAAGLVFGTIGLLMAGTGLLAGPAATWIQRSPKLVSQVEAKVRRAIRPFSAIQKAAQQVDKATSGSGGGTSRTVEMKTPGLMQTAGAGTAAAAGTTMVVAFLTYFLLATGQQLRQRIVGLSLEPPDQERVEQALNEIERQTSRYLVLTTMISIGVGGATFALLRISGVPSAGFWGVVAGVLNFIPYAGALITAVLIGAAAFLAFDGVQIPLIVVGGFFLIHLISGNIVTPAVLGRKLPLNTVALFVCLLFWGWVWGIPGAILAVPLTVVLKVVCDHVDRLRPVALLLHN